MKRSELVANIIIGGIGAFGQGMFLAHTLDSYPFAILNSPPERLYSRSGWFLALIAPFLSLLLLFVFRSTLRPFVTVIPVVACPLIFWLLFRLVLRCHISASSFMFNFRMVQPAEAMRR